MIMFALNGLHFCTSELCCAFRHPFILFLLVERLRIGADLLPGKAKVRARIKSNTRRRHENMTARTGIYCMTRRCGFAT